MACVSSRYSANVNTKTSILSQKHPFYSGNLNSRMPGDSRNACLNWADVIGQHQTRKAVRRLDLPMACVSCSHSALHQTE